MKDEDHSSERFTLRISTIDGLCSKLPVLQVVSQDGDILKESTMFTVVEKKEKDQCQTNS